MKVVLELQDQPSNVRRITVRHDIVIGRGSDCNLRLSAPQVSRRHCFLRVGRDSVSVTDLDSSNGTFVNGKRITSGKRHDLTHGTQLALGPIRFLIHVQGEAVVAEEVKSSAVGGASRRPDQAISGRNTHAGRSTGPDGSTHGGGLDVPDSDEPMNYSLEHAGDAADAHETTAGCENDCDGAAAVVEKFSKEPDPNDSRLEIIDFGRHLAAQPDSEGEGESDPAVEAVLSGESPLWESATEGSADDLDLLGLADDDAAVADELPSAEENRPDADAGIQSKRMVVDESDEAQPDQAPVILNDLRVSPPLQVSVTTSGSGEIDESLELEELVDDREPVDVEEVLELDDSGDRDTVSYELDRSRRIVQARRDANQAEECVDDEVMDVEEYAELEPEVAGADEDLELDETVEVLEEDSEETLEIAADVQLEADETVSENSVEEGESSWFAADSDKTVENPDDDDDIDNELQDFLKGF